MASSRYPDSRYARDRSPYRDRRPSTYGGGYPPRAGEPLSRSSADSGAFPPRDTPRGPKSLVDAPRAPAGGPPSGAPSAPREGRGRGFAGRGEGPLLRDAPPLSSSAHPPHNSWRADRDRDRDRDFDRDRRDRRPSPPRRSPIRDTRDSRDQRDFAPRDIDVSRARRNSRDGPPSAGSNYSDPPLGSGSSYRGSGIGRGRGGREFHPDMRGRGRNFHNDERDRHHDARDRLPERSYRPRSRSRDPVRRDRDPRDDREFDRRDRDDRRFMSREYDSYIGPAASLKSGPRALDTHRGSASGDPRQFPGTPTGAASHHSSAADRLGPPVDSYSRRSSVATEPIGTKESRRGPSGDDSLLASRAEASRERYAPRASSPPAAVPAFGFSSNVWRNPALEVKPATSSQSKPVHPVPSVPAASTTTSTAPTVPTAPKTSIPPGLSTAPPTGPKADRAPERPLGDTISQGNERKSVITEPPRVDSRPSFGPQAGPANPISSTDTTEPKLPSATSTLATSQANSPPQGPAPLPRAPPTGPQASLRANISPSFARPSRVPYVAREAPRDLSPGAITSAVGPRNGNVNNNAMTMNTSPKSLPANIPTGPKADRANLMSARPSLYPLQDRPSFAGPRLPLGGSTKSNQWVRPGLNLNNRTTVPTKREFPIEERDRPFGSIPKAPKLEHAVSATEWQRPEAVRTESAAGLPPLENVTHVVQPMAKDADKETSPKPGPIETRRLSDVSMAEPSPRQDKLPPVSAASSAPEVLEDSDDDLDLDEADFAESEAKYNREKALLEAKRIDLSAAHLRVNTILQEVMLLASLRTDHLPAHEPKCPEESMTAPVVQPPSESITTELPTPKAEDTEDVVMEDKEEKPLAPATQALRLRRGTTDEQEHEESPDLSALPYLGSGPPTPLSDLDQDRPRVPDSIMLAIRDNLRKNIEPELDIEDTLERYAEAYKQWRLHVRELDDAREHEEQERPASAEPGVKVSTPDVQSVVVGPILDLPTATTGRRGHGSRWATELDLETAIKESLKTAEEERIGKKEKEPKRSMADPEKEATVPPELTAYEAQRRRYIDTNFQREPGQGIFVFHYEPPEDDFTEEEHRIMVQHYKDQYAKKWGKLAEILYKEAGTSRTYKDCINHYYATKWGKEYKGKLKGRRGGGRKRGGGAGRGRGAIANMERPDAPGDDGLPLALTETGRPRRSAAPTFGAETDLDTTASTPTPGRVRRQTDADGTQEKVSRRGKGGRERGGRKARNPPVAAVPAGSPIKVDRKTLGVKMEEEPSKRPIGEMPLPMQPGFSEDTMVLQNEPHFASTPNVGISERPKTQSSARPGPSSYWSVTEQTDFRKNVAHFGTDWGAIANHMGTKTSTMVKNQYLRLIEGGQHPDLERAAIEADQKRERGEDIGPPPTHTPAQKRRYETTQINAPRTIAPTPEAAPLNPITLSQASPPSSARFPNIAPQAPQQSKPIVPAGVFTVPETSLASIPSIPNQQSPPASHLRTQIQHVQHTLSQPKAHQVGPPAGYFSDDPMPRPENRPTSQSSSLAQTPRPLQQPSQQPPRVSEQPQAPLFRSSAHQDRENLPRTELSLDHETHLRFHPSHSRHISQEVSQHRPYQPTTAGISPMRPAPGAGSPESRPLSMQHPRHIQQMQASGPSVSNALAQAPITVPSGHQLPQRSAMGTPPVKEELRHYTLVQPSQPSQPSQPQQLQSQSQAYPQSAQASVQAPQPPPAPPAPKPAAEPRKSNLLSLLNDTEPEEPRRKKPSEQNIPSHTPTPQQQTPVAPPPSSISQPLPSRRDPYSDTAASQAPFSRPSYAQQSSLPQGLSGRQVVDLTSDQPPIGRPSRENWQRQQFQPGSQAQQTSALNSPRTGVAQPIFGDSRMFAGHRGVFAQHNTPRANPSPPPLPTYNNSPHLHSRTPSLSGPPGQQRIGINVSAAPQHVQAVAGTNQILQPNPYAQVDPPGSSSQPSGPVGMRPSPHLHTSHIVQQRELHNRNEQSQAHNAGLAYSNPQTPNEHHAVPHHIRGPSVADQYRVRDPRDLHHDFDARNTERDMSRELSHRADVLLREQRDALMSGSHMRSTGQLPSHQDARYPAVPQDRGYGSQRSHTPLARSDHGAPPTLQHPPHSSLGDGNHPLYVRQQEDPSHRFRDPFSRDARIAERIREEQGQQHAAMSRDDYLNRERDARERELREREMREREMREREAHYSRRVPPPPGPGQDQRSGPPMDWTSAVRHSQDRWPR